MISKQKMPRPVVRMEKGVWRTRGGQRHTPTTRLPHPTPWSWDPDKKPLIVVFKALSLCPTKAISTSHSQANTGLVEPLQLMERKPRHRGVKRWAPLPKLPGVLGSFMIFWMLQGHFHITSVVCVILPSCFHCLEKSDLLSESIFNSIVFLSANIPDHSQEGKNNFGS